MIELRWLVHPRDDNERVLQYRVHQPCVDASGALCPGEWTPWVTADEVVAELPAALAESQAKESDNG